MKFFLLSVLAIIALAVQAEDTCSQFCDACADVHDIATISCSATSTTTPCNIVPHPDYGDEDLDYLLGPDGDVITAITADGCRKKCREQKDATELPKPCEFFHFEAGHGVDKTKCSLQTKCEGPSNYCNYFGCESGQLGCNKDCKTSLPCSLSGKTDWDHNKFHVICTDQEVGDVDIYAEDIVEKEIADGTICSTVRKCMSWDEGEGRDIYHRQLAVFCDGSTEAPTWQPRNDTGSVELSTAMISTLKIVEPDCIATCPELKLSSEFENQWWADLVCDASLTDGKLVEPNSCILLCDNHLRMTIDCEFDREGDKDWRNAAGEALTPATLKC